MPRVFRCCCGWPSIAATSHASRLRFSIEAPLAARRLHLSTSALERPWGFSSRGGLALPISLCGCSTIPVRGESRIATLHHPASLFSWPVAAAAIVLSPSVSLCPFLALSPPATTCAFGPLAYSVLLLLQAARQRYGSLSSEPASQSRYC